MHMRHVHVHVHVHVMSRACVDVGGACRGGVLVADAVDQLDERAQCVSVRHDQHVLAVAEGRLHRVGPDLHPRCSRGRAVI